MASVCGLAIAAPAREPVYAEHGMVVAQEPLAADVGVQVLREGGNAVDAAVAVGFALAVTYPYAGNIGGGGFMTVRMADGRIAFIDFREKAPGRAGHDMYLDPTDGNSSTAGWRAVGVPGTVRGLELAYQRYGNSTKSWASLVQPAIQLAGQGLTLSASNALFFANAGGKLLHDPEARSSFSTNGVFYGAGALLVQRDLGRTLARIASDPDDFYTGETARLLANAMAANQGLITPEDLRAYQAVERKPLEGDYHGYHIITAPPPSSGGVCVLQMLGMLDGTEYAKAGPGSVRSYHYLAEVMRRAFADRMEYLGDPDFMMPRMSALLDPAYLKARAAGISPTQATPTADVRPGQLRSTEGADTTHFSIVDQAGNAVAVVWPLSAMAEEPVAAEPGVERFTGERLESLRHTGRPVFVNMTAAWCVTCLVNERVALDRPAVRQAFAARGVVYLRGDWTRQDAGITRLLRSHGRDGVPLYVLYPPGGGTPVVLPQLLTQGTVLSALAAM